MLRQASSRNHRSKGFKIKNALQIFLLVAICIWLLYQVKHSHEKKRAFEERNSQISSKVAEDEPDFFRFGRKDLPHIKHEETGFVNEIHEKEAENEENQEEEEHETKHEANEDEEGKDTVKDEIDEHDEEKVDEEPDHEEESTEEEDKDNHDDEEDKEDAEDKDSHDDEVDNEDNEDKDTHDDEDKDGKDEVDLFESQDHEGGTQEAREENYRRDDASSAVVHESENGDEKNVDEDHTLDKIDDGTTTSSDGSKNDEMAENIEEKVVGVENVTNGTGGVSIIGNHSKDNETMISDNSSSNVTGTENKDVEFSKPENETVSNSTSNEDYSQIDSIKAAKSSTQLEQQANSTGSVSDNSTAVDEVGVPVSNDTVSLNSAQDHNSSGDNKPDETQVESEVNSSNTSKNENGDGEQGESNLSHDDVIPEEVREAQTDVSTLPDIQNEVKMTDDETAE